MPIHEKNEVRDELLDDVYASSDLSLVMPKYKFPKKNMLHGMPTRFCTTS